MKKLVPVVGLLLLATSHASSQTLNRCVDAEGNVSFSDVACDESQASEQVDVRPNDPVTSRAGTPHQEDGSAVSSSGETPTQERLKRRSEELLEEAQTVLDQPRTRRATGNQGGKHRHGRRLQRASNMLAESARSGISDERMEEGLELIDRAVEKSKRYSRGRDGRKRSRHEQQAQSLLRQASSVMNTESSQASAQSGGAGSETTPEPGGQVIDGAGHLPPPGPVTITNCDSTGCWGSDGERYNSTDGQTFFRGSGGTCHRQGNMMHCP